RGRVAGAVGHLCRRPGGRLGHRCDLPRRGAQGILRGAPRRHDEPRAGASGRPGCGTRAAHRAAARARRPRDALGHRVARHPRGPRYRVVGLVLLAPRAREAGPVGRFLGNWYPMLLLGGLYAEVGVLNVDVGYPHDLAIQRLELWVFGSQLSYRWIRECPNPVFSWIMHTCYIAYYAILCASPLGLWISARRDAARRTIFAVMVTFYLCYVVFLFFP